MESFPKYYISAILEAHFPQYINSKFKTHHLGIDGVFQSLPANVSHWRNDCNSIDFLAKQK